ncbi:unnamed protein product [Rotaria socialis]
MQEYQSTLDDINDMEKLEKIEDRIKVLKWKSLLHMNFSTVQDPNIGVTLLRVREEIKLSSLPKENSTCIIDFLHQINDGNIVKFFEDREKPNKRKRNNS